jgi:hypothetical protein
MTIVKLDFEKAFNTIEHEVIIRILRHKGFPVRWGDWIQGILKSGTYAALLSGTPGKVFHCRRGVRQGDPLSPLLFVLAADLLQSRINKARNLDILRLPLEVGYTSYFLIIQYANDTLLIMEACPLQLFTLKATSSIAQTPPVGPHTMPARKNAAHRRHIVGVRQANTERR